MSDTSPLMALRRITERLQARTKSFALVGGLAVTVRSEPRFTRDVDLCAGDPVELARLRALCPIAFDLLEPATVSGEHASASERVRRALASETGATES